MGTGHSDHKAIAMGIPSVEFDDRDMDSIPINFKSHPETR